MLSSGFIMFVMVFVAVYGVLIALVYCGIQGIYLVKTMQDVMPILDKINGDLDQITVKSGVVSTSITTNVTDLRKTLKKIGQILFFITPWLRHIRYGRKLEKMETKINHLLKSING